MNKALLPLLHEVKSYFSHIDVYRHDTDSGEVDENMLDEYTNKGIQAVALMEKILKNEEMISQKADDQFPSEAIIKPSIVLGSKEWFKTEETLPKDSQNVLICTKYGQINEAFLVKEDINKPYFTSEGKIAFEKYEKGGKWYRYRFSDLIDMENVVAWAYLS